MIEIQPATDEEIARIERIVSGQVYSGRNNEYILSLIARIRAGQAKQGEVERDLTMAIAVELRRLNRDGEIDIMEAARCLGTVAKRYTLATPANSRAEAIGAQKLRDALKAVRWWFTSQGWDERSVMVEGIDAVLSYEPPMVDDITKEANFLLDRLDDFKGDIDTADNERDFYGHVMPSMARLRAMLQQEGGK